MKKFYDVTQKPLGKSKRYFYNRVLLFMSIHRYKIRSHEVYNEKANQELQQISLMKL